MSSVYDDISARLDAEQTTIEGEAGGIKRDHDLALSDAEAAHDAAVAAAESTYREAMAPLSARAQEVQMIRDFMDQGHPLPVEDPQQPSAPSGDATTSAPDDEPEQPSEQPTPVTPSDEPSTPTPEPEPTPSTESGEPSPAPQPTATEPITVENLGGAEQIDRTLPVEVPLTTGEVRVVPVGDVLAARDASIEDAALTTSQLDLRRNSDWP